MIIKKITNLTDNVSKEELRKRIAQVGAISLGCMLTLSAVPSGKACETYEEKKLEQEQQRIEEKNSEKNINLLSCKVLVENCSDGTVKHHFVNDNGTGDDIAFEKNDKYCKWDYEYIGITNNDFVVPYSEISYNTTDYYGFIEIPETDGQYIFDYNVPYYVMDTTDIVLPNSYSLEQLYSINDLKLLEEKLNASIYGNKDENQTYYAFNLLLAEVNGEFMCFDLSHYPLQVEKTTNIEDVTKLRTIYYFPSIENDLINLKLSSGMTQVEENIANYNIFDKSFIFEDITSLDQTVRNDFRGGTFQTKSIYDHLTEEQRVTNKIKQNEVLELLEELNNQNRKRTLSKDE